MAPVGRGRRRRPTPNPEPASQDAPEYLAIGEVLTSHGVHGYCSVRILTDFPQRYKSLTRVFLGEGHQLYNVEKVRVLPVKALVKFEGIDTPELARTLSGQLLYIPVGEAMPLPEGEYYWYQIIGLTVYTRDGQDLGQIKDILPTGSNDVYVVAGPEREVLIPAIEDVILEVDLEVGKMVVEPLPEMG
ncbi:MAG: ribosome maturation factor RimM [Chloroflexota bacterium]